MRRGAGAAATCRAIACHSAGS
ncbi:CxxxxCH/CxxCH domain-containing protein [Silicimonas algicola]|nr:CxxxxCH/CxxCH domain-containing protein [Silicimonas algicola]